MSDLQGLVVAVAGAGGSLGRAVVPLLLERGAVVEAGGRDAGRLGALGAGLDQTAAQLHAEAVDLLDPAGATAWAASIRRRRGRIDALLHLVGGWRGGRSIEQTPVADDAWLHDQLVRTVQHATRAFAEPLEAGGRGRFLLVSSTQAHRPSATNASYAAAKAAAEAWTLALAARFAGSGSTANVVVVNAIVTAEMRAESPDKAFRTFTAASDVAETMAWLLTRPAGAVNGRRIDLAP